MGLSELLMDARDYVNMVSGIQSPDWRAVFAQENIQEAIQAISGSHIAVAHRIIFEFMLKYQSSPRLDRFEILIGHLNNPSTQVHLHNSIRQLPTIEEIRRLATAAVQRGDNEITVRASQDAQFLKMVNILRDIAFPRDRTLSPESIEVKALLGRAGIIHFNGSSATFASPVHLAAFVNSLRSFQFQAYNGMPEPGEDFLRSLLPLCIERMRSEYLQGCAIESNVTEKHFHFEFWRALTTILPKAFMIQPEFRVETPEATKAWIDIRIQHHRSTWLIELLRDGNRADQHVARFEAGGRYSLMRPQDIAIIDFRTRTTRVLKEDITYCSFSEDFTITHLDIPGEGSQQLQLATE